MSCLLVRTAHILHPAPHVSPPWGLQDPIPDPPRAAQPLLARKRGPLPLCGPLGAAPARRSFPLAAEAVHGNKKAPDIYEVETSLLYFATSLAILRTSL